MNGAKCLNVSMSDTQLRKGQTMTYSKQDVQFHSDGYRPSRPAVNVKHSPDFRSEVDWSEFDDEPFRTWVTALIENDDKLAQTAWEVGCEMCWEDVQNDAEEVFRETAPNGNHYVRVWSEGRSGGWAIVDGLKDFEQWDAIDLAAWRRFEKYAQQTACGLAHQMVSFLYLNVWDDVREGMSADAMALVQ